MSAWRTVLAVSLLAIALPAVVGGVAQDKPADEPAVTNDWKLEKSVESWYKIAADNKHTGFMHTRIQLEGSGYAYLVEIDASLKVKGELKPISYTGIATLDKRFVPQTMQSTLAVGDRSITFSMTTGAGIKKITGEETRGDKRTTQKFHRGADEEIFCDLQNGLFAMKAKGEIDKPESHRELDIAIPDAAESSLKASVLVKKSVTREFLGKMVTGVECGFEDPAFFLVPGFPIASLTVDGYGRILEIVSAGDNSLTVVIAEDSIKAKPHPETIIGKRSRSPFDKKFAMSQKKQENAPVPDKVTPDKSEDTPQATKPTVEGKILLLRKIVDDMEANPNAEEQLKKLSALFVATRAELLKLTTADAILKTAKELTDRALKCYDPAPRIREQAKQERDAIEKSYRTENLTALRNRLKTIQDHANDPVLQGRPDIVQEIKKYAAEAEQFVDRAKSLVDLRAKKPVISGILYHLRDESIALSFNISLLGYEFDYAQNMYFPVPNSFAIVNGKTVQEGEIVEGCQVRRILEGGIVLGDRGEEVFFPFEIRVK